LCKVLKRKAARLHSGAAEDARRGSAGSPSFIGRKTRKRGFWRVFQNVRDLFWGVIACMPMEGKFPMAHMRQGLQATYSVLGHFTLPQGQPFEDEGGHSCSGGE
jgi:hypothetical protein